MYLSAHGTIIHRRLFRPELRRLFVGTSGEQRANSKRKSFRAKGHKQQDELIDTTGTRISKERDPVRSIRVPTRLKKIID